MADLPGGGACSDDPLAEFLAEMGVLALAALSGAVRPEPVRHGFADLDPRGLTFRFAGAASIRRVSTYSPAVIPAPRHPQHGFSPENS
jgi:hypothetical protein